MEGKSDLSLVSQSAPRCCTSCQNPPLPIPVLALEGARLPTRHPSWPTRRGTCPIMVLKARGGRWLLPTSWPVCTAYDSCCQTSPDGTGWTACPRSRGRPCGMVYARGRTGQDHQRTKRLSRPPGTNPAAVDPRQNFPLLLKTWRPFDYRFIMGRQLNRALKGHLVSFRSGHRFPAPYAAALPQVMP